MHNTSNVGGFAASTGGCLITNRSVGSTPQTYVSMQLCATDMLGCCITLHDSTLQHDALKANSSIGPDLGAAPFQAATVGQEASHADNSLKQQNVE